MAFTSLSNCDLASRFIEGEVVPHRDEQPISRFGMVIGVGILIATVAVVALFASILSRA